MLRLEKVVDLKAVDPESKIIGEETVAEIWQKVEQVLSKLEFEVFNFYMKNYNYKEIASKTGRSEKAVNNALQRIRKKLGEKLGE